MHPTSDKGEIAIDFPDKADIRGFGRECSFDARADSDAMMIRLVRTSGEKREAEIHLHHFLFASILDELANSLNGREPIDETHRQPLLEGARKLAAALERRTPAAM